MAAATDALAALLAQAPLTEAAVAQFFDALDGVAPEAVLGDWDGAALATGHSGVGKLSAIGWVGKTFRGVDDADPIVVANAAGERESSAMFGSASLRQVLFRGKLSTAMIYDTRPIVDHLRRVDDNTLLGAMDCPKIASPGDGTFYFSLKRRL